MSRSRAWMYTINNFASEYEPFDFLPDNSFSVWQHEVGESGTPHLQGYIELSESKPLQYLKKLHSTAHWEIRRGTQKQAIDYCIKDDSYADGPWCYGSCKEQGSRNDINSLRKMMQEGADIEEVKDADFGTYVKYKRAFDSEYQLICTENAKRRKLDSYEDCIWKPWQSRILDILNGPVDSRKVYWIYETEGNVGKSYLAQYLVCNGAYLCTGGKVQDIQYSYQGQNIVVMDLSRTKAEHMDHLYEMVERWKDGSFLSTKYESVMKVFDVPHVLVFANFAPEREKLSSDRWHVSRIENDDLRYVPNNY